MVSAMLDANPHRNSLIFSDLEAKCLIFSKLGLLGGGSRCPRLTSQRNDKFFKWIFRIRNSLIINYLGDLDHL